MNLNALWVRVTRFLFRFYCVSFAYCAWPERILCADYGLQGGAVWMRMMESELQSVLENAADIY